MKAPLSAPLPLGGGLLAQYEVQITDTHACGGAYLKLTSHQDGWRPERVGKRTPYTVMFGPDRCGAAARASRAAGVSGLARVGRPASHRPRSSAKAAADS